MPIKWIYLFNEIDSAEAYLRGDWGDLCGLLGGKGANLAEMTRLNIPIPPGFILTTEACNAYLESDGTAPEGMWDHVKEAIKNVEQTTGKNFGNPNNPLLLSCRSGAKFSMPGMMDTVLNIGLNDETADGMIKLTDDARFVYDSYRRLIQMFGSVVMGVPNAMFEEKITRARINAGVKSDAELSISDWKKITSEFKSIFKSQANHPFPTDPYEQLQLAAEAVFNSWNGKRAIDYRNAAGIPHNLGTAVNIMTMVFGNMGSDSATGVAMTRNSTTGQKHIEGDYLTNAQGEDVVSGLRLTKDISLLKEEMPKVYQEVEKIAEQLEAHYRDMQDMEFTIEKGKLWMLQTRNGKRTAQAAVRIAVEMADEDLISREEGVRRVTPEQVDFFLHPQFDSQPKKDAMQAGNLLAKGLNISPGAAVGVAAFDADLAAEWAKNENKEVIMVRPETQPDDVHGMLAAQGVLTSRGGRTSHAALVARQFGKPAVVGVSELEIDTYNRQMKVNNKVIKEGDWISLDGTAGEVYKGRLPTVVPDMKDPWLIKLLSWADEFRHLGVWTNADYPRDASRAREYGAEGIGLCRTEHMFFDPERLPYLQKMIMTDLPVERQKALEALLPFQRKDFEAIFRVMEGLPVIIRLIDPPLHEFLPNHIELLQSLADLKIRLKDAGSLEEIDILFKEIIDKDRILQRVKSLSESNPMLGTRGVRVGLLIPELTLMQVQAVFEAACIVAKDGISVQPEIMIPLTCHVNELKAQQELIEEKATTVMKAMGVEIEYKFGTMIEIPRAAVTADQLAEFADFFSFGTNDLTQMTFGISRDDAESKFLNKYIQTGILQENPFEVLDLDGVGALIDIAIQKGRSVNPDLECGICGEHGGDPQSIRRFHDFGFNYVSCSPLRVPVARLAAAHAALG